MALADLLNADMATLGAAARQAFAWWVDELRAMVPAGLRRSGARGRVLADLSGAEPVFTRDGRRLAAGPGDGRVTVVLPRARALLRETVLPRLPRADTRALIALDLDRLTPLSADDAVFDYAPAAGEQVAGRQRVTIAVVTRAVAGAALARAAAAGLEPVALAVEDGAGGAAFDFLPALAGGLRMPWWATARAWWGIAGVLAVVNVCVAVWRDGADVARLRETVSAQDDAVTLAQRARGRVRSEEARRAALLARRATHDPLPLLAAVTAALPPPAWVQRLAWDGQSLRLTGFTTQVIDPVSTLRASHRFVTVRQTTTDVPPEVTRYQPFDVTGEVAPPVPPRRGVGR